MKKYRAIRTIAGMRNGDTVESDHEFYANLAANGHIVLVEDAAETDPEPEPEPEPEPDPDPDPDPDLKPTKEASRGDARPQPRSAGGRGRFSGAQSPDA